MNRLDAFNAIVDAIDILYAVPSDEDINLEREQELLNKIQLLEEEIDDLKHAISNAADELEQCNY